VLINTYLSTIMLNDSICHILFNKWSVDATISTFIIIIMTGYCINFYGSRCFF